MKVCFLPSLLGAILLGISVANAQEFAANGTRKVGQLDADFDRGGTYTYNKVGDAEFIEIRGGLSNKLVLLRARFDSGNLKFLQIEDRFYHWDKNSENLDTALFESIKTWQFWYSKAGEVEALLVDPKPQLEDKNEVMERSQAMRKYLSNLRAQ